MDNIEDIVKNVVQKISQRVPQESEKIERIWLNCLEKSESDHTRLEGIKKNKISVIVDSPAWLFHMNTRRGKILKRIQEEIPDIRGIYFRIGKIE